MIKADKIIGTIIFISFSATINKSKIMALKSIPEPSLTRLIILKHKDFHLTKLLNLCCLTAAATYSKCIGHSLALLPLYLIATGLPHLKHKPLKALTNCQRRCRAIKHSITKISYVPSTHD